MKVTDVKMFLVHPGTGKNWLFIKVETDAGVHGWGEAYTQADRDHAILAHLEQMRRYLLGRDPFHIKHFTTVMYLDFAAKRGSMDFYSALSGLELALWDIAGKALNAPIYNLLGGPCRDRIRVYANGWSSSDDSPDETARKAVLLVEQGFTAMKWKPFPSPWRTFISRSEEQTAIASVQAVREAVGPGIDLLIEVHRRLGPVHAVRVARMLERFDPFWYEEPVSARDITALAEVHRDIQLPVVTGEELYTKAEFRPVFELRAADIINPDVCNCGGILELKEIATMAEGYHVAVAPHNHNSTAIGLAATLQVAAVMPNFMITEYFVNFESVGAEIAEPPFMVENGYIELPTAPGLGVGLREDVLSQIPLSAVSSTEYPLPKGREALVLMLAPFCS